MYIIYCFIFKFVVITLRFFTIYDRIVSVIRMEPKYISHGNHKVNDNTDGYVYSLNTSEGHDFNSHMHDCFEFIHVLRGNLLYTVEGSEYLLSDGDIIMTKPEELHSFSFPGEETYQREFLHIYPGFLKRFPELLENLRSREAGHFNRISASVVKKYGIDTIFREIKKNCVKSDEYTDISVLAGTPSLIAAVSRVIRDEKPETQVIPLESKSSAALTYINSHYKENLTLDDIAASMFVSSAYLSRLFKKETGMTVKTYINMRRVTDAKNLIASGHQITSAFWECGFSDYSTFYRAFVKYIGMSPDEFRHSHRAI